MSNTYNTLQKHADYWTYTPDQHYGGVYNYVSGDAPDGYVDPMQWTRGALPNIFPDKVQKNADKNLLLSLRAFDPNGESPEQLRALWIYHQLVRAAFFGKNDPTSVALQKKFPYMAEQARAKAHEVLSNPVQGRAVHVLGENILGGEIDYMADQALVDEFVKREPHLNEGAQYSGKTWAQQYLDASRRRTNSYSFARYAPAMLAAGLAPAALGAFMGRPVLGILLGALLSGGVGYYGYNRLNNSQFKGIDFVDKMLGYAPATGPSAESVNAWNHFNQSPGSTLHRTDNEDMQTSNNNDGHTPKVEDNTEFSDNDASDLENALDQTIEPIE